MRYGTSWTKCFQNNFCLCTFQIIGQKDFHSANVSDVLLRHLIYSISSKSSLKFCLNNSVKSLEHFRVSWNKNPHSLVTSKLVAIDQLSFFCCTYTAMSRISLSYKSGIMASVHLHSRVSGHLILWKCQTILQILILLPLQIHRVLKLPTNIVQIPNEMEIIQQKYKCIPSWIMVPEKKLNLKDKWQWPEENSFTGLSIFTLFWEVFQILLS